MSANESGDGVAGATRQVAALRRLLRGAHVARADDLPALVAAAAADLGATGATMYVVDYDQVFLVPMLPRSAPEREPAPVDGTMVGRAFTDVTPQFSQDATSPDGVRSTWLPLVDGTDRLGVLEVREPSDGASTGLDLDTLVDLASLVAQLLVTKGRVGDDIELTRRLAPMTLAAEMQWNLLPPLTFSAAGVGLSGSLVPAHEVAGDCFDYAVNETRAHVALFDAMGHGLQASLLSSIALGAYRNGRRSGLDLADTVRSIDKFVASQFDSAFVTGIVAELDLATGTYRWASCGHHPALLVRGGHVVKELEASRNRPLGLQDEQPHLAEERLEPGDRVLLYSDGVIESRDAEGNWFGPDRLVDFVTRASSGGLPPAETMRRLVRAILDHQAGDLQDDATTVIVEWRGSPGVAAPADG